LWAKLHQELESLHSAPPESLEALLSYIEFLVARGRTAARPAEGNR